MKTPRYDIRDEQVPTEPDHSVDENITSLKMGRGETAQVFLRENPTTGYLWNATGSPGIKILNNTYYADTSAGEKTGTGGVHSWIMRAVEEGPQEFSAVLSRGAGSASDGDKKYSLNITIR